MADLFDVVVARKLSGGGGGGGTEPLVVRTTVDGGTITFDKTWQEIDDAFPNITLYVSNEYPPGFQGKAIDLIVGVYHSESVYLVSTYSFDNYETITYITNAADGYPAYTPEP